MNIEPTLHRAKSWAAPPYGRVSKKRFRKRSVPDAGCIPYFSPDPLVLERQESEEDNLKVKTKHRLIQKELANYLDKDFFRRKTIRDLIELFCEATTIHGPGHVWHNRRNLLGPLWFLVTCAFSVALLVVAAQYIAHFSSRELQSQTTVRDANEKGLLLPSVVICNRAFFSKRKLRAMDVSRRTASYMYLVLGSPFFARVELFKNEASLRVLHSYEEELQATLLRLNRTLSQLVEDISYTCEEIIIGCRLGLIRIDRHRCCQIAKKVKTTSGQCYFLIAKDKVKQTTNGEDAGLTFYIRTFPNDEPDVDDRIIDLDSILRQGLQVTIASNSTHPGLIVSGHGTMVMPGALTSIETSLTKMDMTQVKRTVDIYEPKCVDQGSLDWETNRTLLLNLKHNDFFRMTRQCLLRLCNCAVYGLDSLDEGPRCSALEILVCYSYLFDTAEILNLVSSDGSLRKEIAKHINFTTDPKAFAECKTQATKESLRPCNTLTFSTKSTTNYIKENFLIKVGLRLGIRDSSNLAAVTIFYPDLFYNNVEIKRLELNDLISELGGYMGLFLGTSLISYIEVGTFISLALLAAFRRRLPSRDSAQANE